MSNLTEKTESTDEVKVPTIGKFKTKGKFVSFMSATQGRVRLFRETAYIDGSQLSGLFDKTKFKMTICDEGTVDFEEIDTDIADEAMLKRLVQQIEDAEVTGYANKFVTSGFTFKDEDGSICYLEVEHQKPIDRLRSLFDEPEISEKGLSALDLLFGGDEESLDLSEEDVETIVEEIENPSEPNEKLKSAAESYIEESFRKMNEQKVNELKERIDKAERELNKTKFELSTAETKVKKTTEELKVLNSRMETLVPTNEPNGIVFHVSEEKKHETGLDENTKHVADKIADLLGLKKDVLFTQLTSGFYEINITDKREDYSKEDEEKEVELNKIINDIKSIDIEGKFEIKPEGGVIKITYTGELNWHEITSKMIRKGFEQDEEFDKFVGSNSYTSKVTERGSEEDEEFEIGFPKSLLSGDDEEETFEEDFDEEEDDKDEVPADFHTKELMTFEEPTDLVIWTEPSIGNYGDADITLTDDYATLGLRTNGNWQSDMETAGFASITTFEKYKKFLDEEGEEGRFGLEATEAVLIPDFKGTITVGIELDKGGYAVDFDTNEDLMHTSEGSGAPFLDFPSGTQMIFIEDHDLNSLKGFLRDKKIKSLGIN
jgi:hypothetical protein